MRKQPSRALAIVSAVFSILSAHPARSQVLERLEPAPPAQHSDHSDDSNLLEGPGHQHHMLHMTMGAQKCAPKFTYSEGPTGPAQWGGLCTTGKMQAPINIEGSRKLRIDTPSIKYEPADVDIVNDCNRYRVVVKFPDNYWLRVGKKPYNLSELHFRMPGENAVKGKRPRMSVQLVHFSPEGVFLVIEVPVVAGKENPTIKTLWEHLPDPGKEVKVKGVKINAADLLPADRSFYRFPGSLTTPICNEVATWMVMKNPIELSEAQIERYAKVYHDNARPLQPLNGRPVSEPQ